MRQRILLLKVAVLIEVYHRYAVEHSDSTSRFTLKGLGYSDKAAEVVCREINHLFRRYNTRILFGHRECAPCNVWRSETGYLSDERLSRFAFRLHVFEEGAKREFGRYLGFLSLRPLTEESVASSESCFRYIAVANITPPRYMLRPRYHIVTCVGGPAEGVLPFRSVPFCFPSYGEEGIDILDSLSDEETAHRIPPTVCLHAALHEAMLLKANAFGYTPVSHQDMITLIWQKGASLQFQQISQRGTRLDEGLAILQNDVTGAGGIIEHITLEQFPSIDEQEARLAVEREAWRVITDYLSNGIPVIVARDFEAEEDRQERLKRTGIKTPPTANQLRWAHTQLVMGMHLMSDPEDLTSTFGLTDRVDNRELPGRFVVHDILDGPFTEVEAKTLLEAMFDSSEETQGRKGIAFLAVMPRGSSLSLAGVRRRAVNLSRLTLFTDFWSKYFQHFFHTTTTPHNTNELRYVARLLRIEQIAQRYIGSTEKTPYSDKGLNSRKLAKHWLQNRPMLEPYLDGYWWCVEVRSSSALLRRPAQNDHDMDGYLEIVPPALAYLWPVEQNGDPEILAGGDNSLSPLLRIRYSASASTQTQTYYEIQVGEETKRYQPELRYA